MIRGKIELADRQRRMEFVSSVAIISTYHTGAALIPSAALNLLVTRSGPLADVLGPR